MRRVSVTVEFEANESQVERLREISKSELKKIWDMETKGLGVNLVRCYAHTFKNGKQVKLKPRVKA